MESLETGRSVTPRLPRGVGLVSVEGARANYGVVVGDVNNDGFADLFDGLDGCGGGIGRGSGCAGFLRLELVHQIERSPDGWGGASVRDRRRRHGASNPLCSAVRELVGRRAANVRLRVNTAKKLRVLATLS